MDRHDSTVAQKDKWLKRGHAFYYYIIAILLPKVYRLNNYSQISLNHNHCTLKQKRGMRGLVLLILLCCLNPWLCGSVFNELSGYFVMNIVLSICVMLSKSLVLPF